MIRPLLYALEIIILQHTIQMNKNFTNARCLNTHDFWGDGMHNPGSSNPERACDRRPRLQAPSTQAIANRGSRSPTSALPARSSPSIRNRRLQTLL